MAVIKNGNNRKSNKEELKKLNQDCPDFTGGVFLF